ncbi:MAG: hypothetical protein KY394_00405 [Actinobacteria bacterium]|nr:hypothetical protein [Actinomycetota bacterium]
MPTLFSYFSYAAAFVAGPGETVPTIDLGLLAIALAIAPLTFIVVGFVSKNPGAARMVLWSMMLLVGIGLGLGYFNPILGAAAGFGVGTALTLNMPEFTNQLRRRLIGVGLALVYMFLLLAVATPAGVLTGAALPLLIVGFADEYGAWRTRRELPVE